MNVGLTLLPHRATHGRFARDLLARTHERGISGARAALETLYRALNGIDFELLLTIWAEDALVHLDDALGRRARGRAEVAELYASLLLGRAPVWIHFDDILEISTSDMVVFVGRERGIMMSADDIVPLRIRTTHCFGWIDAVSAWRLVHLHASIEDPELLARYQRAAGLRQVGQPGGSAGASAAAGF